jgi:hypothetical protein
VYFNVATTADAARFVREMEFLKGSRCGIDVEETKHFDMLTLVWGKTLII